MSQNKKTPARFKVGDWVTFKFGVRHALAQVIEDRGPIGYKGRRLYRLQMELANDELDSFELPEVDLKPAHRPAVQKS